LGLGGTSLLWPLWGCPEGAGGLGEQSSPFPVGKLSFPADSYHPVAQPFKKKKIKIITGGKLRKG